MSYFYFGDINNYHSRLIEGRSYDFDFTVGIPGPEPTPVGGGSISLMFNPEVGASGEFLLGIGGSFGIGVGGSGFSFSITGQETFIY